MKNVRIWSKAKRKAEAIWLGFLLKLVGCQVWNGTLTNNMSIFQSRDMRYQYIDILLFKTVDWMTCVRVADTNPIGIVLVCGNEETSPPVIAYGWRRCRELKMNHPDTLNELIQTMYPLIIDDESELSSLLNLMEMYVAENNKLARAMYSVTELFCSRRIDYRQYVNKHVLTTAVESIIEWYRTYINTLQFTKTTYIEIFTLTYLQNLINEGCIKAGEGKFFEDEIVFSNTNYLMNLRKQDDSVLLLKLMFAHNAPKILEQPMQLLNSIIAVSAPEYINQAYSEAGDIYRELPNQQEMAIACLERINANDIESYQSLYKLGLLYEEKGEQDFSWYRMAEQKYRQVISMLQPVDSKYKMPQEYEYYCKAKYRKLKMQLYLNEIDRRSCQWELEELINICRCEWKGSFLNRFFIADVSGGMSSRAEIVSLMKEKLGYVGRWAENLCIEFGMHYNLNGED